MSKEVRICDYCGTSFNCEGWRSQRFCSPSCGAHVSKNKLHGLSATPEHVAWRNMRNRVLNPNCRDYPKYGGRGISICERWDSFEAFLEDVGPRPGHGMSIERIDNDGNYEPGNCKWGSKAEQSRNRRNVYSAEMDARIFECMSSGMSARDTAALIGKTRDSVLARRCYLKRTNQLPTGSEASAALAPQDQQPIAHTQRERE